MVVEYALCDAAKPMGVAEYRVSRALPEPLQADLPTAAEFAREFPLMSLVELRIEVERELRAALAGRGTAERPLAIAEGLAEPRRLGLAPPGTDRFRSALQTLNRAAHGLEVDRHAAAEAAEVAAASIGELRGMRPGGAP